jgi:hypothetical protein
VACRIDDVQERGSGQRDNKFVKYAHRSSPS